jgi:hypothetical protein
MAGVSRSASPVSARPNAILCGSPGGAVTPGASFALDHRKYLGKNRPFRSDEIALGLLHNMNTRYFSSIIVLNKLYWKMLCLFTTSDRQKLLTYRLFVVFELTPCV